MSKFNSIDAFEQLIKNVPNENIRTQLQKQIDKINQTKLNILVVGATGAGKSSTINALFNRNEAKVGQGTSPETSEITPYQLKNTVIWDSPGLGDSTENDKRYASMIEAKLQEKDENGDALIDLVLCILDGSSRDLGTTYTVLKDHIIPYLGAENSRLIIAINKADIAMSSRKVWDYENNRPKEKLLSFLEEKVETTRQRIFNDTGIDTLPIYYAAGYKEDDEEQQPYNISKLLNTIINRVRDKKRAVILKDVNKNPTNFQSDDKRIDYNRDTQEKSDESIVKMLKDTAKGVLDAVVGFLASEEGHKMIKKGVESLFSLLKKERK